MKKRKKQRQKRTLAGILAFVLVAGNLSFSSPAVKAAGEEEKARTLLARYELLNDVQDSSGNNRNGNLVGNVTFGTDNDAGMILPGGNNSSTNYVSIPGEMFAGQENLTISAWIKTEVNPGNWSALFFGTAAQSNNMPLHYWLFNPVSYTHLTLPTIA